MKDWFPSLPLSGGLWALWLLLNDSLAPGHLLLGFALALLVPRLVTRLRPRGPRLRRPRVLVHLVARVGADVVLSALEIAARILRAGVRPPRGAFVKVPLDLRDPHGLALLAAIITSTPGTAWAGVSPDGARLTLHVLDLQDEAYWVRTIKRRYERPLIKIFEE